MDRSCLAPWKKTAGTYDCRSALTESGVKCDLRKDTVCMMYIDVYDVLGVKFWTFETCFLHLLATKG